MAGGQEFEITTSQRMLSACAGSLINSFTVTPFDVVRIRLQQQELLSPHNSSLLPDNCCRTQKVFWLSTADCSHPCSTIQTTRLTGTWQALKFISLNEGASTLWRGVSVSLVIAVPANMVYFSGYEYIKDHAKVVPAAISPLVAGSVARTLAVIAISPLELLKTRLQSIPNSADNTKALYNLLVDTGKLVKLHGVNSLFKGLLLTLWRDVPFSGIYWLSYEHLKKRIQKWDLDFAVTSFLSGSLSGSIAAVFTNPFDVCKTRLQVGAETKPNPLVKRPSMWNMFLQIAKNEGISAFYIGLIPRILKIAPSCAVMISTYEVSKSYFSNQKLQGYLLPNSNELGA